MKCQKCNGTGEYDIYNECPCCNGTGEIEVTNEDYIRNCTFEELAGAIYEWHSLGYTRGKNGDALTNITEVVEWLKQPHEEK